MTGSEQIHHERVRQIVEKGYGANNDDTYTDCELLSAAQSYIAAARYAESGLLHVDAAPPFMWPWDRDTWEPSEDPTRNLIKAGALIAAEIDRLRRAAKS